MTVEELLEFSVSSFSNIPPLILEMIANVCYTITLQKGNVLFQAGDNERGMYLLKDGFLQLESASSGSGVSSFADMTIGTPTYLGEMSLVSDATHSSICRSTRENTSIIFLPKNSFRSILHYLAPHILCRIELRLLKKGVTLRTVVSHPKLFSDFEQVQKSSFAAENIQFTKYATEYHRKYAQLDHRMDKIIMNQFPEAIRPQVNSIGVKVREGSRTTWLARYVESREEAEDTRSTGSHTVTYGELIGGVMDQFNLDREAAEEMVIGYCRRVDAIRIFEGYVEVGSESEVNLDMVSRNQIRDMIEENEFPPTLFSHAKNQVLSQLNHLALFS